MKCVILQPSYIPWRGVFDQINQADVFVFYDDVQYDKHGWRNRNQVKTHQGKIWLTVPVHSAGNIVDGLPICEVKIAWETSWHEKHWKAISQAYSKAPFFKDYEALLAAFYQRRDTYLADFTIDFTIALAGLLEIRHTRFVRSSSLGVTGQKTDRLVAILEKLGATHYLSGPAARAYIEPHKFIDHGITLQYFDYNYPEYPQLYPPFDGFVSVIDLLVMTGPQAKVYLNQVQP